MSDRGRAVVLAPMLAARGGAERVALVAAETLKAAGYDTVIVAPGQVDDLGAYADYFGIDLDGVAYEELPSVGRMGRFEALRTVIEELVWARIVRSMQPDVFLTCMYGATLPGLAERSLYYIHFPHQLTTPGLTGLRARYVSWTQYARRLQNRGSDFRATYTSFLANSRFTASHARQRWGVDPYVLYPPCCGVGAGRVWRQPSILAVGRFQDRQPGHPYKNQEALIVAFRAMADLHAEGWQLHLAGSVGSEAELARLREMSVGLPVAFHPHASLEELHTLYRESSVYWHAQGFGESHLMAPQSQEHFGITTVEAMSAGAIAMVYDTAGPAEVVADVPGTVRWTSLEELRLATRNIARADPTDMASLRRAAQRRAAEFSEAAFATRLLTLIETGSPRS